jgi:hypothetical protein
MSYFSYFPQGYYVINQTSGPKLVTNLLRRVKIKSKIRDMASLYDLYDVKEGETPESIAYKHFGDTELHWVILMLNDITDRYYGWPLRSNEFEQYVNDKYENPYGIHHYEINQLSGPKTGLGPSDYSTKIQVNSDYPGATTVTNYEYEQRLQDQKRQIKLLNPIYLNVLIQEFQNLIIK